VRLSLRRSAELARQPLMVLVVADNCTDETAVRAREAGALVVERRDEALRGKPRALDHGLAWLAERPAPDAVIFVDADCEVENGFVAAIC
jgi:glycosyltransferase involved in cell wall biosynthesis